MGNIILIGAVIIIFLIILWKLNGIRKKLENTNGMLEDSLEKSLQESIEDIQNN